MAFDTLRDRVSRVMADRARARSELFPADCAEASTQRLGSSATRYWSGNKAALSLYDVVSSRALPPDELKLRMRSWNRNVVVGRYVLRRCAFAPYVTSHT